MRFLFEFVELCSQWHSGLDDMLYAVASCGGLYRGYYAPLDDDTGLPMTNEAWSSHLWSSLASDIRHLLRCADGNSMSDDDKQLFEELLNFINENDREMLAKL